MYLARLPTNTLLNEAAARSRQTCKLNLLSGKDAALISYNSLNKGGGVMSKKALAQSHS